MGFLSVHSLNPGLPDLQNRGLQGPIGTGPRSKAVFPVNLFREPIEPIELFVVVILVYRCKVQIVQLIVPVLSPVCALLSADLCELV